MALTLRLTKGTPLTHAELDANFTELEADLDTAETKLATIETGATADQSDSEIETAYNNQVAAVSQAVAEAGTDTIITRWTAERVKQAIAALETGGGDVVGPASATDHALARFDLTTGKLLQNSQTIEDDSGNLTVAGTVDGRDIATDGTVLDSRAASGANSDITSITGLTTDLTVAQGGTGAGTFTDSGVILGNGTGALQVTTAGTSGQVLTSNGTGVDPTFQTSSVGKIIQVVNSQTGAVATGTTTMPADDTIPQNTEGDEYLSLAVTPTSSSNLLRLEISILVSTSVSGGQQCCALFQDSTASALASEIQYMATTDRPLMFSFNHYMTAGTTSATTFKVRVGHALAGTTTINGIGGGRLHGGVMSSSITITEISA